jgi:uncharacterized protein YecE (DUF72 family)
MTADFVYVRFHGPDGHYGTPYPDDTLASWAARIRSWQDEGREVFAYFNNDAEGYAVDNAQALQDALGNS